MRNDVAVAIACTHADERQTGGEMTDATDELVAAESQGPDDAFLKKEHREQAVRERAYELWEAAGRPHGRDLDHWLSAEQQVSRKDPEA